jgi:hypothetical protein
MKGKKIESVYCDRSLDMVSILFVYTVDNWVDV